MTRWITAFLLLIASSAISETNTISIRAVEARLYYHYTGTLSDPITGKEALWNTIIGEGATKEPSTAVLVDVVVAGPPGDYKTTWGIELVVKSGNSGKVLHKLSGDVGVMSDSGVFHVPFWLPNTGCDPLKIRARVKGGSTWTETTVPFACGE